MAIHIVADSPDKLPRLRALLGPDRASTSLLGSAGPIPPSCDTVIVEADLAAAGNIVALKTLMPKLGTAQRRIFVVDPKSRLFAVQAYALSATHVLAAPVDRQELLRALRRAETPPAGGNAIGSAQEVSAGGARSLASMFSAVRHGTPVDPADAKRAAQGITDSVAGDGLSNWLEAVRHHHEGTYQHCLLVTGVAAGFGLKIGLPSADIERLTFAAMLHDVGKATIPLTVLDKPGRLDAEERTLIETHPMAGYKSLEGVAGISAATLDAVLHHHEYLDGSGYPDGLGASGISDLVRILTISDVFAALIEDRRYKPVMPRPRAYEIVRSMRGKLEGPLVAAFEQVALVA